MADLCAEQASLEEEMRQLEEQLKAKAKSVRKLSQEIIPAKMQELGLESLTLKLDYFDELGVELTEPLKINNASITRSPDILPVIDNNNEISLTEAPIETR